MDQILIDDNDRWLLDIATWCIKTNSKHQYYCTSAFLGRGFKYLHQAIMLPGPNQVVDHINGNGLDNRRCNLRVCTHRQNMQNRRTSNGKSRFRGISWAEHAKKWRATITYAGKWTHIGYFKTEVEAVKAWNSFVLQLNDPFVSLQPID